MKIPSWPAWFPYPISWLRGFVLSKSFSFVVTSGIPEVTNNGDFFILLGIAWFAQPFAFTFAHFVVAGILEMLTAILPDQAPSYIRQWLEDRRCSGAWRHWREGLNAFVVLFLAFVVSLFVAAVFVPDPSHRLESMWKLNIALASLPVAAAYLYQYDLWARQRRAAKAATKSQPVAKQEKVKRSPSKPVDAIEQELNQMRTASGMTRVKPPKQAPPKQASMPAETPEWYVFRSGRAEGPYTKMQLLEIQQITDRTKVRRGETDWRRAGEIPELAAYLTEK